MARTEPLPGMENDKRIPALSKACEEYEKARDEWMKKGGPVRDAKEKVIEIMKEHGIQHYKDEDLRCDLTPGKEKLKVIRGDDEDD